MGNNVAECSIAEHVTSTIGQGVIMNSLSGHHVELVRCEQVHHLCRRSWVIGPVTIGDNINVCFDVRERSAQCVSLALSALTTNFRACSGCDLSGAVGGRVVD